MNPIKRDFLGYNNAHPGHAGADAKCSSAIFCFAARAGTESAILEPEGRQDPALQLLRRFFVS